MVSGNPLTDLYRSHNASPPVTKAKLSELDIDRIPNNHRLRHDLNFDRDLQFRPNWDGEKGRKKQAKADEFWANLSDQLHEFITAPASSQQRIGMDRDWCLPVLLKEVKESLPTLVPSQDRVYLDEGFNVELIMQQFYKGTVDLEKLASWLSSVLKTYCAPGRDMLVDEMYNNLANGNRRKDMGDFRISISDFSIASEERAFGNPYVRNPSMLSTSEAGTVASLIIWALCLNLHA